MLLYKQFIILKVLGGGKCLVTFTPDQAITHEIEVMFNNDQVPGSPFLCRVKVQLGDT